MSGRVTQRGACCVGYGAAWLWQGQPQEELGADVLAAVRRFVRPFGRSMRALGGARFDATASAAAEWADFGGYCMLIPAVELVRLPRRLHACGPCMMRRMVPSPRRVSEWGAGAGGGEQHA